MANISKAVAEISTHLLAKRFAEAASLCKTLAAQAPDHPETLHIMGVMDHYQGHSAAGLDKISLAIKKSAASVKYYLSMSGIQQDMGDLKAAEITLRKALSYQPGSEMTQRRLADVHLAQGNSNDAILAYRRAIANNDSSEQAHLGLARAFRKIGRHAEALVSFQKAATLAPQSTAALVELADTHISLDQSDKAAACYLRALEIDSRMPGLHNKLGMLLMNNFQFEEAIEIFRGALRMNPRDTACHVNLGLALLALGDVTAARKCLMFAVELDAHVPHTLNGLGVLEDTVGNANAALEYFKKAVEMDADFVVPRYNRAIMLLRQEDLEIGLKDYEWRWQQPKIRGYTKTRPYQLPTWSGQELLEQKLLIWGEQGLGDEIRTAGMIPDLLERRAKVILECEPRLAPLFQRSFPEVHIVAKSDPPSPDTNDSKIGWQTPADSLTKILRPTLDQFPRRASYLKADPVLVKNFRDVLRGADRKLVVGLSWNSKNAQFGHGKSTSLVDWAPTLKLKGLKFVDLQYGDTADDRASVEKTLGVPITHIPDLDLKNDIDGLAALISACDLVITVSNTTAHLAGALGKPTWVILPTGYFQLWFWFSNRTDSPWYPSVTLYRQKQLGDWTPVLRRIAADLKNWSPPA
jgi:tetratricopeptide (TPR) repeat protein